MDTVGIPLMHDALFFILDVVNVNIPWGLVVMKQLSQLHNSNQIYKVFWFDTIELELQLNPR